MMRYILQRLLLMIPTLMGILLVNFLIMQIMPGGPVDHAISTGHFADSVDGGSGEAVTYTGSRGMSSKMIDQLKEDYGLDKPWWKRFGTMIKEYLTFDLGQSYFQDKSVVNLILEKLPVTISLGLWSTLLIYLIAIPLGIAKALRHGSRFDTATTTAVMIGYTIPTFLLTFIVILFFASGEYWEWFPLRGLLSDDHSLLSFWGRIGDYFWHLFLPIVTIVVGGLASLCLLTKNAFLEEIHKDYVITARAKGLTRRAILYHHIFPNAIILLVAKMPHTLLHILVGSNLIIEIVFSLDGLGLLGFDATMSRDYPVIFGTLYVYTLCSLFLHLVGDVLYRWLDRRISFEAKS
jgi:microcin C transport system permease protein